MRMALAILVRRACRSIAVHQMLSSSSSGSGGSSTADCLSCVCIASCTMLFCYTMQLVRVAFCFA